MNLMLIFVAVLFFEATNAADSKGAASWDYTKFHGYLAPDEWYKSFPKCSGTEQSPIKISYNQTVYDKNLRGIGVKYENPIDGNTYTDDMVWSIHNNGHTVSLSLEDGLINTVFEHEEFSFLQMHFHWGFSEHEIVGNTFVAELHLVHRSLLTQGKFGVLGFLFKLSTDDNEGLNPLIRRLKDESANEHKKKYFSFDLSKIIPFRVHNYYRYMGSLTTPNCMEGINWFLTADPVLTISQKQINIFQNLKTHHNTYLKNNSRPIQDLNDRKVRRSWDESFIVSRPAITQESKKDEKFPATAASNKLEINFVLILAAIVATYRFF